MKYPAYATDKANVSIPKFIVLYDKYLKNSNKNICVLFQYYIVEIIIIFIRYSYKSSVITIRHLRTFIGMTSFFIEQLNKNIIHHF